MKEYYKAHVWRFTWRKKKWHSEVAQYVEVDSGTKEIIAPTLDDAMKLYSRYVDRELNIPEPSSSDSILRWDDDPVYVATIVRDMA